MKKDKRPFLAVDLVDMDPEEFANNIRKYSVYARVAPEHKVQIVEAWQKQGRLWR